MTNSPTKMYLIYIDESYDDTHFVYSAMFVDAFRWNSYFAHLLEWRRNWFEKHQIALDTELHATDFIAGRGQPHHNRDKVYRAELFYEAIGRIEKIEDIKIINAITSDKKKHLRLFDWMLTRINNTLKHNNAFGVLICDEGNENKLTSVVRTMQKENHIPDRLDMYGFNAGNRNLPLERIIEDPLFKTSKSSYFIQLADFSAFSLLRNEKPVSGSTQPKVFDAFEQLDKSLVKVAFKNDPRKKGIIRISKVSVVQPSLGKQTTYNWYCNTILVKRKWFYQKQLVSAKAKYSIITMVYQNSLTLHKIFIYGPAY